jgi:hypothetical protein
VQHYRVHDRLGARGSGLRDIPSEAVLHRFPDYAIRSIGVLCAPEFFDTAFIRRFREPESWNTPEGELWRLYSREAKIGEKSEEICVGYALKAPWKILETPDSLVNTVDEVLKREADRLVTYLQKRESLSLGSRPGVASDGFAIIDSDTQQVEVSLWLPAFLPTGINLPSPGYQLFVEAYHLKLLETESSGDGRLLAASIVSIGSLRWLAALCGAMFLGVTSLVRYLSQ